QCLVEGRRDVIDLAVAVVVEHLDGAEARTAVVDGGAGARRGGAVGRGVRGDEVVALRAFGQRVAGRLLGAGVVVGGRADRVGTGRHGHGGGPRAGDAADVRRHRSDGAADIGDIGVHP